MNPEKHGIDRYGIKIKSDFCFIKTIHNEICCLKFHIYLSGSPKESVVCFFSRFIDIKNKIHVSTHHIHGTNNIDQMNKLCI